MRLPAWPKLAAPFALTAALAQGADPPTSPRWRAPWAFLDGTAEITQGTGALFRAAVGADLDADGDTDVLVGQAVSAAGVDGTPAPGILFLNEGGRFVDRTAALIPLLGAPQVRWWMTVADFGGPAGPPDGLPDVFVAGGQGVPSRFFLNLGRDAGGTFLGFQNDQSRLANSPITSVTHSYNSRAADFDGDGLMDLVVFQYKPNLGGVNRCQVPYAADCYGQTRLLINSGGTLVDETATRLPARNEPSIFGQAADVDGDGAPDIALVNLKNGLVPGVPASVPSTRVLINDGSGAFPAGLAQQMPERINPASGLGTYSLEVADFDGNGRRDLFIINWGMAGDEARDGVLLNRGSGTTLFTTVAYPRIDPALDNDGDHPVAGDLDRDGRMDVVVAQFSSRPYFLLNRSRGGAMELVEATPPEVPANVVGFRNAIFDANGDGVPDVWLAMRDRNYLTLGGHPEREPNGTPAAADTTRSFPALRTGLLHFDDEDVFSLPAGAAAGARVRLRPSSAGDLRLRVLDAAGGVLFTSQAGGPGAPETIDLPAASGAAFARVERQGDPGGVYRLEILRPAAPLDDRQARAAAPPPAAPDAARTPPAR